MHSGENQCNIFGSFQIARIEKKNGLAWKQKNVLEQPEMVLTKYIPAAAV